MFSTEQRRSGGQDEGTELEGRESGGDEVLRELEKNSLRRLAIERSKWRRPPES